MSTPLDKKLAVARRRQQVAELYLQSWSQAAIAAHLAIAQPTVSGDLKTIHAQWRASAVRDFDLARQVELKKLDRIEREAWAAWERSQQPARTLESASTGKRESVRNRLATQIGDPRYLAQINQCIVSRRALLALDAAATPRESTDDQRFLHVQRDRLITVVATLRQRERVATARPIPLDGQPGGAGHADQCGQVAAGPPPGLAGPGDP